MAETHAACLAGLTNRRPGNGCGAISCAVFEHQFAVHPHHVDTCGPCQRVQVVVALGDTSGSNSTSEASAPHEARIGQVEETARQRRHAPDHLLQRNAHLAAHAQRLRETPRARADAAFARPGHQAVGADTHARPAEEALDRRFVAIMGDDGNFARRSPRRNRTQRRTLHRHLRIGGAGIARDVGSGARPR